MRHDNNYLSEFEREFEVEDFSSEPQDEFEAEYEFEDDYEGNYELKEEADNEFESDEEFESDGEFESDDEYELDDTHLNSEFENYLQEYQSPENEFEDRLYRVLSGNYETHFEMEQAIDGILHEMEVEYFWKAAKNLWKKHKNKLLPLAKNLIPGGTLASLAKFAGGDIRGLLKKGLTMAANAYLPGVGGMIAGQLLNNESADLSAARRQAQQTVNVAKNAYQNMANLIPKLRRGANLQNQISQFSRQALSMARGGNSVYRGKTKRVIPVKQGSIVVVRPDRVIIYS